MGNIIIGFSKSKKKLPMGSYIIRLYQGTPFSHTYVRIKSSKPERSDHILHASEGLVQHMSSTQFDKKHEVVEEFKIEVSDANFKILKNNMHELSGANYSTMQNIGIAMVTALGYIGIRIANPWQEGWNCSEYVLKMLQILDVEVYKHLDPNMVTPKDIYKLLKSQQKE